MFSNPDFIQTMALGSSGASALRRSGAETIAIVENDNGTVIHVEPPIRFPELKKTVSAVREETIQFIREEEQYSGDFDQDLALNLVKTYIEDRFVDDVSAELAPVGITGGAGYGKTYVMARIVKETSATRIKIIAPTNAATKVIRTALLKQDALDIDEKFIDISTAHKGFERLHLTPWGEAVFGVLATEMVDREVFEALNEDTEEAIAVAVALLEKPRTTAQASRLANSIEKTQGAVGKANYGVLAMRTLSLAGANALDSRFCYWALRPIEMGELVIIDEAGMIGSRLVKHILNGGGKVVLIGDPFQLPPVGTTFVDADGIERSDVSAITMMPKARTVHLQRSRRTADGNSIPLLAGKCFSATAGEMRELILQAAKDDPEHIRVFPSLDKVPTADYDLGPVLCWRNATRLNIAQAIRRFQKRNPAGLEVGEFLMCHTPADLQHYPDALPFSRNERVRISAIKLDFESGQHLYQFEGMDSVMTVSDGEEEELGVFNGGEIWLGDPQFNEPKLKPHVQWMRGILNTAGVVGAQYWGDELPTVGPASAITVHKSQGSEWPVVTVNANDILLNKNKDTLPLPDGRYVESWRRLLYVALTRTSGRVNILIRM